MKKLVFALVLFVSMGIALGQDLTGRWEGGLPQDDKDFTFALEADITQSGILLFGNMQITRPGTGEYVIQRFNGKITDSIVQINEYEVIKSYIKPENNFGWCIKNLIGSISIDSTQITVAGNWTSTKTWFPDTETIEPGSCAPGKFILQKSLLKEEPLPISYDEKIIFKNVLFKVSTAELLPGSYPELNQLITFLESNSRAKVKIEGHTDRIGSSYANLILSKNRATAVKEYLINKGIKARRISTEGFGDKINICKPKCKENRRVEFVVSE